MNSPFELRRREQSPWTSFLIVQCSLQVARIWLCRHAHCFCTNPKHFQAACLSWASTLQTGCSKGNIMTAMTGQSNPWKWRNEITADSSLLEEHPEEERGKMQKRWTFLMNGGTSFRKLRKANLGWTLAVTSLESSDFLSERKITLF